MGFDVLRKPGPSERNGEATPFIIEQSISHLVALSARLFARALQTRFEDYGVSVGQWPLLLFLWEQDGLTQKELSRRVQIEEPTATRTLGRMERDGLVRRVRGARDRREVRVHLTERGRALRDELIPCVQEVNSRASHGLSEQEKARLTSLLRYLIARLG